MSPWIVPYGYALARVTGLLAGLPTLSAEVAPMQVRGMATIALTLVLGGTLQGARFGELVGSALVLEFIIGLAMGMTVRVVGVALLVAGELIGMQMGIGFQQLVDPRTREMTGALSAVFNACFGVILFATGAYRDLFRALRASFELQPPGDVTGVGAICRALFENAGFVFTAGLRIALPLVAVACASQLTFGLLTKVAPQLNAWTLGFLVTIGFGLIALTSYAPALIRETAFLAHDSTFMALDVLEGRVR